jgi:hypothetical protein
MQDANKLILKMVAIKSELLVIYGHLASGCAISPIVINHVQKLTNPGLHGGHHGNWSSRICVSSFNSMLL